MNHDRYPDAYVRDILQNVRSVAIVGASHKEVRPSYFVARYLLDKGYQIFPINPGLAGKTILGQPVYARLSDVTDAIDMVDIFRNSEAASGIVDEALELSIQGRR